MFFLLVLLGNGINQSTSPKSVAMHGLHVTYCITGAILHVVGLTFVIQLHRYVLSFALGQ
jgi:hypothetical protein